MTLDIYKFEFDENNKKYIQVYNRIKNLILDGKLVGDEKLPPIRKLSALLGVNSVTIVKAYDLLENEGYLIKRQGSGCYVSKIKKARSISAKSDLYRLDTGNPLADIFPINDFKKAVNMALDDELASLFNYDDGNGIKRGNGSLPCRAKDPGQSRQYNYYFRWSAGYRYYFKEPTELFGCSFY